MRTVVCILILTCQAWISLALIPKGQVASHFSEHGLSPARSKATLPPSSLKNAHDTLKLPADSLHLLKRGDQTRAKYDSVQQALTRPTELNSFADSVANLATGPMSKVVRSTVKFQERVETAVQNKLDSVESKLNKPLGELGEKVSSVTKPIDEEVEVINNAIEQKTTKLQADIQNGFDKATDGTVKAPVDHLKVDDLDLPMKSGTIQGVDITKPDIPGLALPIVKDSPGVSAQGGSLKLPDANLNADQLKQKMDIPELDKLGDAKGEIDRLSAEVNEVSQHARELQNLKNLDSASIAAASKKAEEKIMDLDQMKGVKEQTQVVTKQQVEYNALIQRYKDKKLMQQEIARKAKEVVNEKLSQNTPEVKTAMSTLNKSKKNVKELLSWKNNGMSGKPLGQRLVPGITLQAYNRDVFMIDFGLQLGYRLSGRIRTGFGGVYRIGFDKDYPVFVRGLNVYGGRTYMDFLIKKGIYVHGECELLNATHATTSANATPETKQYVSAGYFGLGKQFNITKKIKGHTLLLYRAEFSGKLVDQSKVNLRLGFDLRTDKKKRKIEDDNSTTRRE